METTAHFFLPVIAMMIWTLLVSAKMGLERFSAVKNKEVDPRYFKTYRDDTGVPDYIIRTSNHYNNLFQIPVLFYVVMVMIYVTQHYDNVFLTLAWVFVLSRVLHTVIHLFANHPIYRLVIFSTGVTALTFMLIRFLLAIM